MSKNTKAVGLTAIAVTLAAALAACSPSRSSDMTNPPPKYAAYTESGGAMVFDVTPKAEIIFVVDNSESMSKHLTQLTQNIDRFVDAFAKNNPIQYHLAVVSVYDHRTFNSEKFKKSFATDSSFILPQNGEFLQVRSAPNSPVAGKYFISSEDADLKNLLKNTINIGVKDLNKGGPEFEESFSPIAAAYGFSNKDKLSKEVADRQKDFFFGPDAYKIVFFITDATDDSDISGSELYYNLVARANGNRQKVLAFGAIVPSSDNSCPRDPGGAPAKIEEFLKLATRNSDSANVLSLCGSFGEKLAGFGEAIRAQTANKVIALRNSIPVISNDPSETLHVCYGATKPDANPQDKCQGSQEVPFETAANIVGFRYDPSNNSIYLNPDLQLNPEPNGKLRVVYTAANPNNSRLFKAKRFGDQ